MTRQAPGSANGWSRTATPGDRRLRGRRPAAPGEWADDLGLAWKAAGPGGLESHEPWQAVQGVLSELGFSPVVHPEEPEVIQLRTCPLLAAARRHPEVICPIHQGLLDAALAAAGRPGVAVRLHPFAEPGACLVTRTPEGQPG